MALTIGTRLGSHEITALLGKGGMGEVYRARDLKLKREVAIKILPEEFSRDADRVSRFQREAEVLASLNHSNIAAIHDFEETNGTRYLVLELVEGETLADRIARGPVPLEEALIIAKQICDALEAAHGNGIVHRDLKPANIKVKPNGDVKVLDFGLARVREYENNKVGLSNSPTLMSASMPGMIMGTAAYMSPEQAKGKEADRVSDVWAFGCVLYEMLTGRAVFEGETTSEIFAGVLKGEPDWNCLPVETPPAIRRLLRRCLQKNRMQRFHDMADARIEIEEADTEPAAQSVTAPSTRRRDRMGWIVAALSLIGMAVLAIPAVFYLRTAPPDAPEMRLEITTPATSDPFSFALSPNGRQLVFVASGEGTQRLWLRPLNVVTAQPVAGTEGASYPFWSPDNRSVGFFADGRLKRIDIGGGSPQVLADAVARGGTWSPDGVILFSRSTQGPLFRVKASGGDATPVTTLDRQASHRFPQFLPGGRQFLFYAQGTSQTGGIYIGSLDSTETKRLTASDAAGVYMPPGWLLWVRGGTLVAQRLDLARLALNGDRINLADLVGIDGATQATAVSASATALLAYRSDTTGRRQLTWFDRSGKAIGTVGAPDNTLFFPRLSPDGRRVAGYRIVEGNSDIWILDGSRTTRFTFDPSLDGFPIWSPDGRRVVFRSNRKGKFDLYQKSSDSAGSEEGLLLESGQDNVALDWSRDGRFLLYQSFDPQTDWDLWVLPMEADGKPWPFLKSNFTEKEGQFSRDGRWVAYVSNESGRFEVYVRPFLAPAASSTADHSAGQSWQVSTAGGISPTWRPDGKEVYYIAPDGKLMAAAITVNRATLEPPGAPVALFQTRIYGGTNSQVARQYDVSHDGRFLINTVREDNNTAPITLLQNWKPPGK
jgi:serine/threonine protein kinase/Tol biopolymer transport system component